MSALEKQEKLYTYGEYKALSEPNGEKWELIDGEIYVMASSTLRHQDIVGNIYNRLCERLGRGKCRVVMDVDTRLNYNKGDMTAVRPDILVVCTPSKIDKDKGSIKGAPDLVIEVLSPSNSRHDLRLKYAKYRDAGVKEIWFVDPVHELVTVYRMLDNDVYDGRTYGIEDEVPVCILDGFAISGEDIFEDHEIIDI
ncbi:MAG: Uma2 family endonuclease [Defluviitaleaceae bacterium]|nr:Uma2 family endonuclease [Defluviitaleaceae bacterium]